MAGAAVVAVALAGAFALTREDSTVVGQPSALPILVGARAEAARASVSTAVGSRTYVPGPALVDPGGSQAAWSVAGGDPDPAAVRRLADAFGVSGDLRRVDGAWQIGADGEPVVRVSTSPGTSWTYLPGGYPTVGVVCSVPASPPAVGSSGSGSATSSGDVGVDACPSTPAPEALPTASEAEAAGRDLLRRAGIDVAHMRIAATSDEWSALTTATPELDGTPTPGLDTVISFGSHAAITSASGWLGEPHRADTYPLIGIDAAIGRLNDGQDLLDGLAPLPGMSELPAMSEHQGATSGSAATGATSAPGSPAPPPSTTLAEPSTTLADPATTIPQPPTTWACPEPQSGAPVTTTTVVGDGDPGGSGLGTPGTPGCPASICPAPPCPAGTACPDSCTLPTCDPAACPDPFPGPTVVPDPADRPPPPARSTVTLTSVDLVLAAVPGTDGALWLVPAYRLTGDDGSTSTVLGIDESFIAPPAAATASSVTVATATAPPAAPVPEQGPASSSAPATTVAEPCPSSVVDCRPGAG